MSIKPGKYDPNKPDIELFDYQSKKRYGLKLEGSSAMQIGTISQDDSVLVRNAGKRVGDFDEQRSWKGGRGIENLSDNAEGFWDSKDAWTLSDNFLHPTILWQFARGLRNADFSMPSKTKSMSWKALLGTSLYMSMSWTSDGVTADYGMMWIRRIGTPGTLTFKLHSSSAGNPGTVLQTVTVTTTDITDFVSVLQRFDWTGTQALSAATIYHISIYGATTDNKNNHWEVGGYEGGSTGKYSSDGSSWSLGSFDPYYIVSEADVAKTYFSFFLDSAMYVVDTQDNGTASSIWINGDRGKATSATSTTLNDTARSWITNRYTGAWVKIIRGTGKGQTREIASNGTTGLVVSIAFDITPDTTSEYIVYATEWFTAVATSGLGKVVSQPLSLNQIVYFPQGVSVNIRRMIWTGTAHAFSDDGTNKADFLVSSSDTSGIKIWRALNNVSVSSTISYATAVAYGNPPTALTFSTQTNVGDSTYLITGLCVKDEQVYVFKENGVWLAQSNGSSISSLQSGLDKTPSPNNGATSIAHQQFMYYSWLHSLIRVYGSSHDDIGQDWSGYGLPDSREGVFSSLDAYTSLLVGSINSQKPTNTSSVLAFDGLGWHEILRAYSPGRRIRMVKIQPCEETRNRIWTAVGSVLIYQEMPLMKGSPRLDPGVRYMHEAVVESSAVDMGTASGLPKFIKELTVYAENLGNGNEIRVDYQVDDAVHTSTWTEATALFQSPESVAFLGLNNIRKFAYRLRIITATNSNPVKVRGVTPNGYARAPYKMVWTLRCRADNVISKGRLVKPDALMRWLLDNARFPGRLEMRSQYELAHKFFVIIHPPRMFPYKPAANGQAEESVFTLVLEEA